MNVFPNLTSSEPSVPSERFFSESKDEVCFKYYHKIYKQHCNLKSKTKLQNFWSCFINTIIKHELSDLLHGLLYKAFKHLPLKVLKDISICLDTNINHENEPTKIKSKKSTKIVDTKKDIKLLENFDSIKDYLSLEDHS